MHSFCATAYLHQMVRIHTASTHYIHFWSHPVLFWATKLTANKQRVTWMSGSPYFKWLYFIIHFGNGLSSIWQTQFQSFTLICLVSEWKSMLKSAPFCSGTVSLLKSQPQTPLKNVFCRTAPSLSRTLNCSTITSSISLSDCRLMIILEHNSMMAVGCLVYGTTTRYRIKMAQDVPVFEYHVMKMYGKLR